MKVQMTKTDIIKWIVIVLITLATLFIPETETITSQMKMFISITVFFLALTATEVVHILLVSALLPAAYLLFGVATPNVVFSPWLGTTIYMVMGAFVLAVIMQDCGLLERIAYLLMSKIGDAYYKLIISFFLVGIVLMILTFGNGYIIMGALGLGLCMALNFMGTRMAVIIGFACLLGGVASKSYTYTATAYGIIMNMSQGLLTPEIIASITPLKVMFDNFPLFLISFLILLIAAKWYKPKESLLGSKEYFQKKLNALGPIKREEKINCALLVLLIIWLLTTKIHGKSMDYGFMILPYLAFLPFLHSADVKCLQQVNFPMIFFMAACMSIGTVATSLGIAGMVASLFETMITSSSPAMIFGALFLLIFMLNFLLTPVAIWGLITAPVITLAINLGMDPIPFVYALLQSAEAIIFPYEYVPYLVFFGFGMMGMKDFLKLNIMRCIIYFLGIVIILVPWWSLIGIL